jgi:starch synthase (maltosyl-transferring)
VTGLATLDDLVRVVRSGGLAPLVELDVRHVRREAPAVAAHPERFRDPGGEGPDPRPPHARPLEVRLDDAHVAEAWRRELASALVRLARAGAGGLLVRAAHRAGAGFFRPLLAAVREEVPDFLAIADCLGEPPEVVEATAAAGFDMVLDSCAWWDLRAPWYLEQHERFRRVAGIVSSPVPPFGPAAVAEGEGSGAEELRRRQLLRLALAATTGNGILLPAGFEYGAFLSPDDPTLRPGDPEAAAERAPFDISAELGSVLAALGGSTAFASRGPLRRVSAPDAGAVALLRLCAESPLTAEGALLGLFDPDPVSAQGVAAGPILRAAGGRIGTFRRILPGGEGEILDPAAPPSLPPLGWSLWWGEAEVPKVRRRTRRDEQASEKRLYALAENRVAIERVTPELDGGRFPVKRAVGDVLRVEADISCDGHDRLALA